MATQTKAHQDIKILLVGPGNNGSVTDYQSLQKYEIFDWKMQRLLWIGYQKNIGNVKCHLSDLPKDVIKYIITFCSIYHKKNKQLFVEHITKDTKLQDLVDKYREKNINEKHVKQYIDQNQSYYIFLMVRVWCQWMCIKRFYNWKKQLCGVHNYNIDSCTSVTKNNAKRWVEIPNDCLDVKMDHKLINLIDYNHIVIEFLCVNDSDHDHDKSKPSNVACLHDTILYWPLTKIDQDFNCQDLQVGDIVDVKVKFYIFAYIYVCCA